jgi:hypothetical protein
MATIGSGGMNIHKNYITTGAGEKSKKERTAMAKTWTQRTFQIDPDILRAEFRKRGLTLSGASLEMGHCDSYLNAKFNARQMNENDAKLLELMFHIPKSLYEVVEKTEEETVEEVEKVEEPDAPVDVIDYGILYKTIYSAVFAAINEAFK